jgi:hypothetical protein
MLSIALRRSPREATVRGRGAGTTAARPLRAPLRNPGEEKGRRQRPSVVRAQDGGLAGHDRYPSPCNLGLPQLVRRRAINPGLLYSIWSAALCGLTTKTSTSVLRARGRFRQHGATLETFKSYFRRREGDSIRFRTYTELSSGILTKDAYAIAPQPRLVDILWSWRRRAIEPRGRADRRPVLGGACHAQNLDRTLAFPEAATQPLTAVSRKPLQGQPYKLVGNLTLLTDGLTCPWGTKASERRREVRGAHGAVPQQMVQHRDQWTSTRFTIAGSHLAQLAVNVWTPLHPISSYARATTKASGGHCGLPNDRRGQSRSVLLGAAA